MSVREFQSDWMRGSFGPSRRILLAINVRYSAWFRPQVVNRCSESRQEDGDGPDPARDLRGQPPRAAMARPNETRGFGVNETESPGSRVFLAATQVVLGDGTNVEEASVRMNPGGIASGPSAERALAQA